jgi:hypothetical protein
MQALNNQVANHENLNAKINVAYIKTDDVENNINNNNDQNGIVNIDNVAVEKPKNECKTFKVLDGNVFL